MANVVNDNDTSTCNIVVLLQLTLVCCYDPMSDLIGFHHVATFICKQVHESSCSCRTAAGTTNFLWPEESGVVPPMKLSRRILVWLAWHDPLLARLTALYMHIWYSLPALPIPSINIFTVNKVMSLSHNVQVCLPITVVFDASIASAS